VFIAVVTAPLPLQLLHFLTQLEMRRKTNFSGVLETNEKQCRLMKMKKDIASFSPLLRNRFTATKEICN
jgi:hypothetical protein